MNEKGFWWRTRVVAKGVLNVVVIVVSAVVSWAVVIGIIVGIIWLIRTL